MEKKITPSSTKTEIFEAYNDLMKQMNTQTVQPKESKEKEARENVIKTAVTVNKEGIIQQIAGLKISLNNELEKIEETLINESRKLSQVQDAIKIQEERLSDLYAVNATTDSLSVMLALQSEKKESFDKEIEQKKALFENEMTETRIKWEKEKKNYELLLKEDQDKLQKQRKREEEEYGYNISLTRKKDTDLYEQKKAALEKELTDRKKAFDSEMTGREQSIIAAETELKELREKVSLFPKQLEEAIKKAVGENTANLQMTFKFEKQLKDKEFETDIKLRDQEITSLKNKISDLESQLIQQSSKADQADKSAKDIAIKAIESSVSFKVFERSKENKDENAKA